MLFVIVPAPCPPAGGRIGATLMGIGYVLVGVSPFLFRKTRTRSIISLALVMVVLAINIVIFVSTPAPSCSSSNIAPLIF